MCEHGFLPAPLADLAAHCMLEPAAPRRRVRSKSPRDRRVVLATADHDFSRLHVGHRGLEQLPAAYAFLLTWGTDRSIYSGDEIGMR